MKTTVTLLLACLAAPAFAAEMSHSNSDMTPMQQEYMMSMETIDRKSVV